MKVRAMKLNSDEQPSVVTVDMSVVEAVYIATVLGKLNGIEADAHLQSGSDLSSEIYDCLTGSVFNRFWEDGVDGARRSVTAKGSEHGGST